MSETIAVLNAGSSSIKFCLFQRAESGLRCVLRGQIEGLQTRPHFI